MSLAQQISHSQERANRRCGHHQSRAKQIAALLVSVSYSSLKSVVSARRNSLAVLAKSVLGRLFGTEGQALKKDGETAQLVL